MMKIQRCVPVLALFALFALVLVLAPPAESAPKKNAKLTLNGANWIWRQKTAGENDAVQLIKTFDVRGDVKAAQVIASCDNHMAVSLNGKQVLTSSMWEKPVQADVTKQVKSGAGAQGVNVISAACQNAGGPAGFVLKLQLTLANGKTQMIVTDGSWQAAPKGALSGSVVALPAAAVIGKYGIAPWGALPKRPGSAAVPAGDPTAPKGFKVERIYDVPKNEQGSWVSITFDNKGRLLASDQGGKGIFRVTLPKLDDADGQVKVEKLPVSVSNAQGMVWAFDSLYVNRNGGGLWRVTDSNHDGELDKAEQLIPLRGGGEHGPHAVIKTEDGKGLYFVGGNHTDPPDGLTGTRMPHNWSEDLLLPRQWDARGHARGKLAPGGWICRTDPQGKQRVLISNGYRNNYDIALNRDGEIFGYDADMEWDMGSPWYRPTRVCHAVSGSEFGWRSGTGKWPPYFPDSVPPVINIGPGSPTGVVFGYGAKFPARYQDALYILDWTFATIYAIHLEPHGASYTATKEEFITGRPLNVTDIAIGPDGAMYFTVGGRGSQSALYRVTYHGKESTAPSKGNDTSEARAARALRHKLEAFHGRQAPKAVATAWPHLGSEDRFIRFAARIAIEHQPAKTWQQRALTETDPTALIHAAIALARQGDKALQPKLLARLNSLELGKLDLERQLALLRAYALTFVRMGKPDADTAAAIAKRLDAYYPANNSNLNRELCRVLVYLDSPTVVAKTLKLMKQSKPTPPADWVVLAARNPGYGGAIVGMLQNMPNQQNIHYAFCLRNVRYGWTLEQRRQYFKWFVDAAKETRGGASYQGFLANIRKEALANCSNAERAAVADLTGERLVVQPLPSELPKPKGPGKAWTMKELQAMTEGGLRKRDYENGKKMYAAAYCVLCHRFDGRGGAVGPDLTSLASRFSYKDLLDNILEPSKVVSDQYESTIVRTKDGDTIIGRIIEETKTQIKMSYNPYKPFDLKTIAKSNIDSTRVSKTSMMPADLLRPLNKDEMLDLLAYLMSRGDPKDRVFR